MIPLNVDSTVFITDWFYVEDQDIHGKRFDNDICCILRVDTEEFGSTYSIHILDIFDIDNQFKSINQEVYDNLETAKLEADKYFLTFIKENNNND